ncbi:MAG: hypothetical protein AB1427_08745 [Thermodesulfobacteriota bacterium]
MTWLKIREGARYAGISSRKLEGLLRDGLRYAQLPSGLRLTRAEWIDAYLEKFEVRPDEGQKVDQMVDDLLQGIS